MFGVGIAETGKGKTRLWVRSALWPGTRVPAFVVEGVQVDDGTPVVFGITEDGDPIILGTIGQQP